MAILTTTATVDSVLPASTKEIRTYDANYAKEYSAIKLFLLGPAHTIQCNSVQSKTVKW